MAIAVDVQGAGFSIVTTASQASNLSARISPHESENIWIQYEPAALPASAVVLIKHNDPAQGTIKVIVLGTRVTAPPVKSRAGPTRSVPGTLTGWRRVTSPVSRKFGLETATKGGGSSVLLGCAGGRYDLVIVIEEGDYLTGAARLSAGTSTAVIPLKEDRAIARALNSPASRASIDGAFLTSLVGQQLLQIEVPNLRYDQSFSLANFGEEFERLRSICAQRRR